MDVSKVVKNFQDSKNQIKNTMEELKLDIGSIFSGIQTDIIEAFTSSLEFDGVPDEVIQNLTSTFNNLITTINNIVQSKGFNEFLEEISKKFKDISEKMSNIDWQKTLEGLTNIGKIALNGFYAFFDILKWLAEHPLIAETIVSIALAIEFLTLILSTVSSILPVLDAIKSKWGFLNNFKTTLILLAIAAAIGLIVVVIMNWENIMNFLKETVETGIKALIEFYTNLWNAIKDIFLKRVEEIINTFEYLKNLLIQILIFIGNLIIQLVSGIVQTVSNIIQTIITFIPSALEFIWNTILQFINTMLETIPLVFETIINFISSALEFIWNIISQALNTIFETISSIFQMIINFISTTLESIWNVFSQIFNNILQFIISIFQGIWNTISNIINTVLNTIKNVLGKIQEIWSNVWNTVSRVVSDVWNGIWGTIKGVINLILSGMEKMVNGVIDSINVILGGIDNIANTVGSVIGIDPINLKISYVSLPRLAKGGVLTRATAFIGGEYTGARSNPEIVSPQSILMETFDTVLSNHEWNRESSTAPINVSLIVGNTKLGEILLEDLRSIKRQTGKNIEAICS